MFIYFLNNGFDKYVIFDKFKIKKYEIYIQCNYVICINVLVYKYLV